MTVAAESVEISFAAPVQGGAYAVPIDHLGGEVAVWLKATDGAMALLRPGIDYTLTPAAGRADAVTVQLLVGAAGAAQLVVRRDTRIVQEFEAPPTALAFEAALDRAAMVQQELADMLRRRVAAPHPMQNLALPRATPLGAIRWNAAATALETYTPPTDNPAVVENGDAAAILAAATGGAGRVIIVGPAAIAASVTLPGGVVYDFTAGSLSVAAGQTVTIKGVVEAGNRHIFTGPGVVTGIKRVRPEWWGAKGDNATDDAAAFNAAHASQHGAHAAGSDGDEFEFRLRSSAYYVIRSGVAFRPTAHVALRLRGSSGTLGSRIIAKGTGWGSPAVVIQGSADVIDRIADFRLEDFSIYCDPASDCPVGLQFGGGANILSALKRNVIDGVHVDNFPACVKILGTRLLEFRACSFSVENRPSSAVALAIAAEAAGQFTGDMDFFGCQFQAPFGSTFGGAVAIAASASGAGIAGLRFIGSVTYKGAPAVGIAASGGGFVRDVWFDAGAQSDGFLPTFFAVTAAGGGSDIRNIQLNGMYFSGDNDAGGAMLSFVGDGVATIYNLKVIGCAIQYSEDTRAVLFQNCRQVVFANNSLHQCDGTTELVRLDGVVGAVVSGNSCWTSDAKTVTHFLTVAANCSHVVAHGNSGGGMVTGAMINDLGATSVSFVGNV